MFAAAVAMDVKESAPKGGAVLSWPKSVTPFDVTFSTKSVAKRVSPKLPPSLWVGGEKRRHQSSERTAFPATLISLSEEPLLDLSDATGILGETLHKLSLK
jgi:hypothetical protein